MTSPLIDQFGRQIDYLRLSVTDRCDLRCTYCMAEKMTFLPKKNLLSYEEIEKICAAFIARGVKKIRLTGGEPLVRRDFMKLVAPLSQHLKDGTLSELTLTTNGMHLSNYAAPLKAAGVKRINVSLDTLNPKTFEKLTRRNGLDQVLKGLHAAKEAGLSIKINTVALKNVNTEEIPQLMQWAHGQGFDMTLIEVMPMGEIDQNRYDQYIPLTAVKDSLTEQFTLTASSYNTGGPSRYFDVHETGGRIGMITPLTQNFCMGCNRVRVTCTGRIYMCLGQDNFVDLREAVRSDNPDLELDVALDKAMRAKPKAHDFEISKHQKNVPIQRHMSLTGG